MVFLVPKVYYGIKEKGRQEGLREARLERRREAWQKGWREGWQKGQRIARERILADLDAAGITDPEILRIVMNCDLDGAETPLAKSEP